MKEFLNENGTYDLIDRAAGSHGRHGAWVGVLGSPSQLSGGAFESPWASWLDDSSYRARSDRSPLVAGAWPGHRLDPWDEVAGWRRDDVCAPSAQLWTHPIADPCRQPALGYPGWSFAGWHRGDVP